MIDRFFNNRWVTAFTALGMGYWGIRFILGIGPIDRFNIVLAGVVIATVGLQFGFRAYDQFATKP